MVSTMLFPTWIPAYREALLEKPTAFISYPNFVLSSKNFTSATTISASTIPRGISIFKSPTTVSIKVSLEAAETGWDWRDTGLTK